MIPFGDNNHWDDSFHEGKSMRRILNVMGRTVWRSQAQVGLELPQNKSLMTFQWRLGWLFLALTHAIMIAAYSVADRVVPYSCSAYCSFTNPLLLFEIWDIHTPTSSVFLASPQPGFVEMRVEKIAWHYLRTWFLPDITMLLVIDLDLVQ